MIAEGKSQSQQRQHNAANWRKRQYHQDVSDILVKDEAGTVTQDVPPIVQPERRESCRLDFRAFLLTYKPERYALRFSEDHERLIALVQSSVLDHVCQLIVYPRGSGKTSICLDAVEWAALYGHKKFPMLFGGEDTKSKQHMTAIKSDLLCSELLNEDFPEICYPIRQSEGMAIRANYQKYDGEPTNLKLGSKQLIFPDIPHSRERGNAGVIIGVGTIAGSAARGSLVNGKRPDYVLIDDPQTRASAKSRTQVEERLSIVTGDILGMAGPAKHISAVMTATVIYKDDLADRLLKRMNHPEWNGIRIPMIKAWPKNMERWTEWNDIRRNCHVDERSMEPAHEFYRQHRVEMDAEAEIYWEDRVTPGFVSALESAMDLYFRDPVTFASEYQNEPMEEITDASKLPSVDEIAAKQHGLGRGIIPDDAEHLVAMVDVQQSVLYWLVAAFKEDFSGYVIDYGTYPDQGRHYFGLADIQRTMQHVKPGTGFEGALYHCLGATIDMLEKHSYRRRTGEQLKLSVGLVDAQYGDSTDTVYKVISERGMNTPWYPSHGRGVKATQKPFSDHAKKPGERIGLNWRIPRLDVNARRVRHVIYETNWWKAFHAQRWGIPLNERGSLSLYQGGKHRMFAEHLHAEYGVVVEANQRKVTEFMEKPNKPDNHYLDLMVGCCVAASIAGCQPEGVVGERKRKKMGGGLTREFLHSRGK